MADSQSDQRAATSVSNVQSVELELAGLSQSEDPLRTGLGVLLDRVVGPFRSGIPPEPQTPTGFFTDTTVCIGCKACEVACKQWNQLPSDGLHWSGNSYDNTEELSATSWRHVKFIEQFPTRGDRGQGSGATEEGARDEGGGMRDEEGSVGHSHPSSLILHPSLPGRWLMMSDVCKHCAAAPCQQACPTGAIVTTEFSSVYIQPDICNGCAYCVAACPFGVATRSSFDGHAHKCTFCYDRQKDGLIPACAKACPTQSIQFGPVDELHRRASDRVRELQKRGESGAYLYGDAATETFGQLNSFYLLVDRPGVYGLPEKPYNPWLHLKQDYVRAAVGALSALAALLTIFLVMGH